jgi:hypothetical protein
LDHRLLRSAPARAASSCEVFQVPSLVDHEVIVME